MPNIMAIKPELGVYKRRFIFDSTLALYLPLWHPDLIGSPIISKDLNAHSCTVVGATWGLQGRTFAGGDDYISVPNHAALNFGTGDFSVGIWFKTSYVAANTVLIGKTAKAGFAAGFPGWNLILLSPGIQFLVCDGTEYVTPSYATDHRDGLWHFLLATWVAATEVASLSVDGAAFTTGTTPNIDSIDNTSSLELGRSLGDGTPTSFFTGAQGEAWAWNRALSLGEGQQIRNATRWRY